MDQLSTRTVYRNRWMTVREDVVRRPDGTRGIYGVVDKPDFALVIPWQDEGVWLVQQFRYPVGRRAWEFPQGSWSGPSEGDAATLARSELAEETGLRAGRLERLGYLHGAYGFCSQGFDVFLASELRRGGASREASEQDMSQAFVSMSRFRDMVRGGDIVDAASIAAFALLGLTLDSSTARR